MNNVPRLRDVPEVNGDAVMQSRHVQLLSNLLKPPRMDVYFEGLFGKRFTFTGQLDTIFLWLVCELCADAYGLGVWIA